MSAVIDWNIKRNKTAAGVMIAGFVLLILSAFNPLLEILSGTPPVSYTHLTLPTIYCV